MYNLTKSLLFYGKTDVLPDDVPKKSETCRSLAF
jgi:hypothetical protein